VAAPVLAPRLGTELLRERGGVRYHPLQTRSLLNRCDSSRVPFDFTVNPYRGCAMGCRYCYAAYTHEYIGRDAQAEFHSVIYVKRGGERTTARQLARLVGQERLVALGTATDPYQPGEASLRVTRTFLESAARLPGLRLSITTKGALILRDLDLLQRIHARSRLSLHVSLISTRVELLRQLEPWAPPPTVRLETLRRLVDAGLTVSLSLAPVLPGLTDSATDLDALLGGARAAGVERFSYDLLFLRSPTRESFLRFLANSFQDLAPAYRKAYQGRAYLGGRYVRGLRARIERLARVHGLRMAASEYPEIRPALTHPAPAVDTQNVVNEAREATNSGPQTATPTHNPGTAVPVHRACPKGQMPLWD
jgi:DNA repair photolyase